MTPQSEFLILAPVRPDKVAGLRALLAGMNAQPGHADPANTLVPFGAFPSLHVARFAVLVDETLDDLKAFDSSFPNAPIYLAFLGDCDGPAEILLDQMAARCAAGLSHIFSFCDGFELGVDVRAWMQARLTPSQAYYVNQIGRTVTQAREEAALHAVLSAELQRARAEGVTGPERLHQRLRKYVQEHGPSLTPPAPTPLPWLLGHIAQLIAGVIILIVAGIVLLITSPIWLLILRRHELSDPEIITPYDRARRRAIAQTEDYDVTNPFTAIGAIKPGPFRSALVTAALWLLNFGCRFIYKNGRLARVGTIHFARWVVIDQGRRVLFISNYDGSLDSYMDDFINKVAFGLNLVFSNGVGYPTTNWLLLNGALREEQFKDFLRRRQQLTDVWYKAYPGLTAFNLARNAEIRQGLEREAMGDAALRQWLAKV